MKSYQLLRVETLQTKEILSNTRVFHIESQKTREEFEYKMWNIPKGPNQSQFIHHGIAKWSQEITYTSSCNMARRSKAVTYASSFV